MSGRCNALWLALPRNLHSCTLLDFLQFSQYRDTSVIQVGNSHLCCLLKGRAIYSRKEQLISLAFAKMATTCLSLLSTILLASKTFLTRVRIHLGSSSGFSQNMNALFLFYFSTKVHSTSKMYEAQCCSIIMTVTNSWVLNTNPYIRHIIWGTLSDGYYYYSYFTDKKIEALWVSVNIQEQKE